MCVCRRHRRKARGLRPQNMAVLKMRKFIDIAVNLTDPMFSGVYNGKQYHIDDVVAVLDRCKSANVEKIIVTGTSLEDSARAIQMTNLSDNIFCTVGCHPTNCKEFETNLSSSDEYLNELKKLAESSRKVVAFGECGLDYDRLQFCSKDLQKKYFRKQLKLNSSLNLPLFLHCRNATDDFLDIIKDHPDQIGVIHSFTDSENDLRKMLQTNFFIGVNGCSLKTESNLKVVELIPKERMMLETDSPWCDVRKTHASYKLLDPKLVNRFSSSKKDKWHESMMVKGRNEPANIWLIFDAVAKVKKEDPDELCQLIYENTNKMFFKH